MKKFLISVVIAVLVIIPAALFAQTAISDSELDAVNAQTGVTIDFANVTVNNTSLTSVAFGDAGGFTGYTGDGWAGLTNITINGDLVVMNGSMVLDIGTNGSSTRANITLPTVSVGGTAGLNVVANIVLAANGGLSTNATTIGTLDVRGLKMSVSGPIQIYAH